MPISFSVIIATCDRPERLVRALECVAAAIDHADGGHEIIVVDNGGMRPARDVVEKFAKGKSFPVRHLTSEPRNKAAALNVGIKTAQNNWLAFTDDDCLPTPEWLIQGGDFVRSYPDVQIFGGRIDADKPDFELPGWLKTISSGHTVDSPSIVTYSPLDHSGFLDAEARVPYGANVFVSRETAFENGGYNELLWKRCGKSALGSEDSEFAMRLRSAGIRIGYCHQAVVRHPIYRERITIMFHLRSFYHSGVREVLFPSKHRRTVRHAIKGFLVAGLGSVGYAVKGDWTASVWEAQNAAFCVGEIRGIWKYGEDV